MSYRNIVVGSFMVGMLWGIDSPAAEDRPNIVMIMCDDMGYSDIGCYGGEIKTPHLDSLAAGGIRYREMYNTSKCTTTRSALLSGRYVTGKTYSSNYSAGPIIGEVLQAAGYRTLWSGKNHSTVRPPERGFDRFYGFQGGACSFWNPGDKLQNGGKFPHIEAYEWMVDDKWLPTYVPEDPNYYMTDEITNNALGWLEEYKGEEKPFMLYLAYNSPHWPLHAKDEDIAKYKGAYNGGYQKIREARYAKMIKEGVVDPKVAPLNPQPIKDWNTLSDDEKAIEAKRMEIHAAMVDNLDQNIGRVIAKLKEHGEFENTLILFFADNGASHERDTRAFKNYKPDGSEKLGSVMTYECIGRDWSLVLNSPFAKHKSTSHEGGVCSPLIAHWQKTITRKGSWSDETVHLVDMMSTFVDISGATYPKEFKGKASKPLEGVSLAPTFTQGTIAERSYPMGFFFGKGKAIRDGKWKLVSYKSDSWELYDLSVDRTEINNLAAKMPERAESMKKMYTAWAEQCQAGLPKKSGSAKSKKKKK